MLTPVAPPGAEIPRLDALWNLLRTLLGFCEKALASLWEGFMHGVLAAAAHWPLLTVILLIGLLVWGAWPWFSALFPRLAAWLWPHLPITLGVLAFWSAILALGVHLTFYLWTGAEQDWKSLTGYWPEIGLPRHGLTLRPLDWLWPWLPSLVALLALLWLAARHFSRRSFHALWAALLLSLLAGVTTHQEPEAPTRPVPEAKMTDLVADRVGDRILSPVFHRDNTQPDLATLVLFGLGLVAGFVWLDRVNLRQSLQPIRVTCIEDVDKKSRPDLEQLMRECLHRNTPHVPSPLPGGGLIYWQDFVEQQYSKDSHWFTRAAALVTRVLRQPRGMDITGTLLHSRDNGTVPHSPEEDALNPRERFGIRIHMVDVYSRQTLMARTFWSTHKVEHAVEQAAYSAMQRALEECGNLPEWAYWREDDAQAQSNGSAALRDYHEGVLRISEDAGDPDAVKEALQHFKSAAKRSPGSALARLQFAEALEASDRGDVAVEVYLDLINRFPHLMVARFRLASACRAVERWRENLYKASRAALSHSGAEESPAEHSRWTWLREALSTQAAGKLLRPNLLSVGKSWAEGRSPRALGDLLKGWPAPVPSPESEQLVDVMLVMANRSLKELERAGRWAVVFWSLKNTAERRLFWRTVFWPPRRFRASYLSVKAARRCVELRQLQRWKAEGSGLNTLLRTALYRVCLFRTWLLALEARASVRLRGHWLGSTHYQLACFYSLRMWDEGAPDLDEKVERAHEEAEQAQGAAGRAQEQATEAQQRARDGGSREALEEVQRLQQEALDAQVHAKQCQQEARKLRERSELAGKKRSELARDATEHLSLSLRDPDGPFSTGTLRWLVSYVDLEPLKGHPSFGYWGRLFQLGDKEFNKAMQSA